MNRSLIKKIPNHVIVSKGVSYICTVAYTHCHWSAEKSVTINYFHGITRTHANCNCFHFPSELELPGLYCIWNNHLPRIIAPFWHEKIIIITHLLLFKEIHHANPRHLPVLGSCNCLKFSHATPSLVYTLGYANSTQKMFLLLNYYVKGHVPF